jgi:hypothetical protein
MPFDYADWGSQPTTPVLPWLPSPFSAPDMPGYDETDRDQESPQWPTQLYDINGNPTTMLPAGQPVPSGSYTSIYDANVAKYQSGGGNTGSIFSPILTAIPPGGQPGDIGYNGQMDTPTPIPVSPKLDTPNHGSTNTGGVNIPGIGNTGTIGGGGGGVFGTNIDFSLGGVGTLMGALGAIGAGSILTGPSSAPSSGSSGGSGSGSAGQSDTPTTTIPILPPISTPQPTVTQANPIPPTPISHGGTVLTDTMPDLPTQPTTSTAPNQPATTTIPIIPPLIVNNGGGSTGTAPTAPTGPFSTPSTTTPTMPTQTNPLNRNFLQEGLSSNAALGQINPGIFGNYANVSGAYGQQDQSNFGSLLPTLGANNAQLTNFANQQTVGGNTALRQGNLADAQAFSPAALSLLQQLNPNQYGALNQVAQQAGASQSNPYMQGLGSIFQSGPQYGQVNAGANPLLPYATNQAANAGYSPLGGDLQQMAREQLALGSSLSDQQKRDATQAAREAWSARGLINSPGAVAEEVLNKDRYGQALLAQRQAFASNVNQLGMGQQGVNNSYTLGVLGANQNQGNLGLQAQMANQSAGLQAQNLNQGLGYNLASLFNTQGQQGFTNALQNAYLQSSNAFNPFATITSANTQNQGTNNALFNQGAGFSSGQLGNQYVQNMVNPFAAYPSDVYGSNFNAENARYIAAGNNAAAMAGAQDAASGQIANSFLNMIGQYLRPTATTGTPGK